MAKKKKNKKKQKQLRYNKKQFADIICQQCGICKFLDPTFCYEAYKLNPKAFMDKCYMALLKLGLCLKKTSGNVELIRFQEVFCYSGLCGPNKQFTCMELAECFNEFKKQVNGEESGKNFSAKKDKKQRKRERRHEDTIVVAYPTFFSSDNEEFKAKIEEILTNGD
jgi:hypothetical protein